MSALPPPNPSNGVSNTQPFPPKPEIFPREWKIGAVVAALFGIALVTVAILATKGKIHLPGWIPGGYGLIALKGFAGLIEGMQILSLPLLACWYCSQLRKQREAKPVDSSASSSSSSSSSHSSSASLPIPKKRSAHTPFGYPNAPVLGAARGERPLYYPGSVLWMKELPEKSIEAFPQILQSEFLYEKNLECYFCILQGIPSERRYNLALHPLIFADFSPNPCFIRPHGATAFTTLHDDGGLKTKVKVGICGATGLVNPGKKRGSMIPIDMHGHAELSIFPGPRFSQDAYLEIELKRGINSANFYLHAQHNGRAIAIHTLLINDMNSKQGQLLQHALQNRDFGHLSERNFPFYNAVAATLSAGMQSGGSPGTVMEEVD